MPDTKPEYPYGKPIEFFYSFTTKNGSVVYYTTIPGAYLAQVEHVYGKMELMLFKNLHDLKEHFKTKNKEES